MRRPVPAPAMAQSQIKTFPAPTRGWIANENLMMSGPGGARVLENWFPTQTGIRLRGGSSLFATIGTDPVESLFTYVVGSSYRVFAADEGNIFEITSVADPEVAPTAEVTGQTSGNYSTEQIVTAGGSYLILVNGADDPLLFDGTDFTVYLDEQDEMNPTDPYLDGASGLDAVWKYRSRLFFTNGTMSAYYLNINSILGTLTELPLSSVFRRGGYIMFGATWSLDSGDGIDDKCVFVTSEGEVAVYEGGDPSNALTWNLVGRYDIAKPLGKNAYLTIGGDLLLLTYEGIVPVSQVIQKDPAALSLAAITVSIEPEWKREVITRNQFPWNMAKWISRNMGIVALPKTTTADAYCFVVNLQTGAWAKYTGWDTRCVEIWDDILLFGTSEGTIARGEFGGDDQGSSYVCTYVGLFDHLGMMGTYKQVNRIRGTFLASKAFTPRMTVTMNYTVTLPAAPNPAAVIGGSSLWDSAVWDQSTWDGDSISYIKAVTSRWFSAGRSGIVAAPVCMVTCESDYIPDAELVGSDVTYEGGAFGT